jgi:hypothetical protein
VEFDKTINVSTVVALVGLLGAMGTSWATLQSQVTEQKTKLEMMQIDRNDKWREIREDLKEIRDDQKQILQRMAVSENH